MRCAKETEWQIEGIRAGFFSKKGNVEPSIGKCQWQNLHGTGSEAQIGQWKVTPKITRLRYNILGIVHELN